VELEYPLNASMFRKRFAAYRGMGYAPWIPTFMDEVDGAFSASNPRG
jgi:hypothetical protein